MVYGCGSIENCWVKKGGQVVDILLRLSLIDSLDPAAGIIWFAMDIPCKNKYVVVLKKRCNDCRTAFYSTNI